MYLITMKSLYLEGCLPEWTFGCLDVCLYTHCIFKNYTNIYKSHLTPTGTNLLDFQKDYHAEN